MEITMVRDNWKKEEVLPLTSTDTADLRRGEAPSGAAQGPVLAPDPEVTTKGKRRYLTAAYKARILRLADGCTKPGDLGALLRREGIYSSQLSTWRRQRDEGLVPQKRGRKKDPDTEVRRENAKLERQIERLTEKLRHAELIIDVQKKVAALLGNPLPTTLPNGDPI
jgi:transposase